MLRREKPNLQELEKISEASSPSPTRTNNSNTNKNRVTLLGTTRFKNQNQKEKLVHKSTIDLNLPDQLREQIMEKQFQLSKWQ